MWPIQLAFRLLISCRIFLYSLTLSNTSSFLIWSVQLHQDWSFRFNPGAANWHNTYAIYQLPLWCTSWGWASNALNMYKPLILNQLNRKFITFVSLNWCNMMHGQQNIKYVIETYILHFHLDFFLTTGKPSPINMVIVSIGIFPKGKEVQWKMGSRCVGWLLLES
jgi:hypothetical protein